MGVRVEQGTPAVRQSLGMLCEVCEVRSGGHKAGFLEVTLLKEAGGGDMTVVPGVLAGLPVLRVGWCTAAQGSHRS